MGRTWDESAYVEYGYKFLQLVKKGDFTNSYWYRTSDEPPLVRYIYAIPSYFDVSQFSPNGDVKFKYDYTYSRIVSAVASSVSVIFVVLVGWELLSPFVGVIAGAIFYVGSMPEDPYKFASFSIIPAIGSAIFFIFGIWTKHHYSFSH